MTVELENTAATNNTESGANTEQTTPQVETTTPKVETPPETKPETQPEAKPEEKPADKPAEDTKSEGAPETYEDFKVPEGMTYDKAQGDKFAAVAKELGLSQSAAQKLVDHYAATMQASVEAHAATVAGWAEESEKTFGKDGIEQANRALSGLATPEFVQYLKDTGLGNHPQMIGMFQKVYKATGEDGFVDNNSANTNLRNDYTNLYPSMKDFKK